MPGVVSLQSPICFSFNVHMFSLLKSTEFCQQLILEQTVRWKEGRDRHFCCTEKATLKNLLLELKIANSFIYYMPVYNVYLSERLNVLNCWSRNGHQRWAKNGTRENRKLLPLSPQQNTRFVGVAFGREKFLCWQSRVWRFWAACSGVNLHEDRQLLLILDLVGLKFCWRLIHRHLFGIEKKVFSEWRVSFRMNTRWFNVTFWLFLVGGHQQPLKGPFSHHLQQSSPAELPGKPYFMAVCR